MQRPREGSKGQVCGGRQWGQRGPTLVFLTTLRPRYSCRYKQVRRAGHVTTGARRGNTANREFKARDKGRRTRSVFFPRHPQPRRASLLMDRPCLAQRFVSFVLPFRANSRPIHGASARLRVTLASTSAGYRNEVTVRGYARAWTRISTELARWSVYAPRYGSADNATDPEAAATFQALQRRTVKTNRILYKQSGGFKWFRWPRDKKCVHA